jgi:hypothetical protein
MAVANYLNQPKVKQPQPNQAVPTPTGPTNRMGGTGAGGMGAGGGPGPNTNMRADMSNGQRPDAWSQSRVQGNAPVPGAPQPGRNAMATNNFMGARQQQGLTNQPGNNQFVQGGNGPTNIRGGTGAGGIGGQQGQPMNGGLGNMNAQQGQQGRQGMALNSFVQGGNGPTNVRGQSNGGGMGGFGGGPGPNTNMRADMSNGQRPDLWSQSRVQGNAPVPGTPQQQGQGQMALGQQDFGSQQQRWNAQFGAQQNQGQNQFVNTPNGPTNVQGGTGAGGMAGAPQQQGRMAWNNFMGGNQQQLGQQGQSQMALGGNQFVNGPTGPVNMAQGGTGAGGIGGQGGQTYDGGLGNMTPQQGGQGQSQMGWGGWGDAYRQANRPTYNGQQNPLPQLPQQQPQNPYQPYQPQQNYNPNQNPYDANWQPNIQPQQYNMGTPVNRGDGSQNFWNTLNPWGPDRSNEQMQRIQQLLPVGQFDQNNFQYSNDFNEAQRRFNLEYGQNQNQNQFQQQLSTRQQNMAERQLGIGSDQWNRQFGHTQNMDLQNLNLSREQMNNIFRQGMDQNQATRDVANIYGGANRYQADQQLQGQRYMSDAQRYQADQNLTGNRYQADQQLQGQRYMSDQQLREAGLYSEAQRFQSQNQLLGTRYEADRGLDVANVYGGAQRYGTDAQERMNTALMANNISVANTQAYGRSAAPQLNWARSWG